MCIEWHICAEDGTCDSCGGISELSCTGETCKGWLTFRNGQCVNTFAVDPSTDSAICALTEKGLGGKSSKDWCYWYAAYEKGDRALCVSIDWEAMREKCEAGANPDYYYVISFPGAP
jgi:hypothetical protein